jgi:hypothetical protein
MKSPAGQMFDDYLRTGRQFVSGQKFNPYHDPRNGQFTFAPGGAGSAEAFIRRGGGGAMTLGGVAAVVRKPGQSDRPGTVIRPLPAKPRSGAASGPTVVHVLQKMPVANNVIRPGMGHNGGPPLRENVPLRNLFPGLAVAEPAMAIAASVVLSNPIGPTASLITSMSRSATEKLIRDIKAIDPKFRFESLGEPLTPRGWSNQLNQLQWVHATAAYRIKGDHSFLQAETVRFVQGRVDRAYEEGSRLYNAGKLLPRLSKNEAIGNFVDAKVRIEQRDLFRNHGISIERGQSIQVNRRAYNSDEGRYTIPDSRIGNLAIDVSLTAKTSGLAQIRGFFRSDFQPEAVIIIRPSQLGPNHTYLIRRSRGI